MLVLVAEDRQVPHDLAGPGCPAARGPSTAGGAASAVRVGLAHDDEDLAALVGGAAGPPLAAVDRRSRRRRGRSRSGCCVASERRDVRLGHREAERISPSSSGSSHRCFCSAVPNRCSVSMLPVSGAWQLIASGAMAGDQPVISATAAYSRFDSPDSSWQEQVPQAAPAGLGLQLLQHRRVRVLRPRSARHWPRRPARRGRRAPA